MERKQKDLGLIVGANLKRLIKESDCKTQEEFAYCFGTSPRNVGRWINEGIKNLDIIQQLAIFFDVDVLTLLL
ncbi:MAG: helix-turn-helix transcriptional regulator [Clostridia bacterium]|nr:helix-turn-helix transcriptional regulator [Clostridia bacterium]